MSTYNAEIYRKYRTGDPFTAEELDRGLEYFLKVADLLEDIPEFALVANEARYVANTLEGYKRFREEFKTF